MRLTGPVYRGEVANLTITVPDDILRRARARAAREGVTVSSVLRAELARYVDDDALVGSAWDRFVEIAERAGGRSTAGRRRWTREEIQR